MSIWWNRSLSGLRSHKRGWDQGKDLEEEEAVFVPDLIIYEDFRCLLGSVIKSPSSKKAVRGGRSSYYVLTLILYDGSNKV
jgi:hypothetical protein